MTAKKQTSKKAESAAKMLKGTAEIGYWDFRRQFCKQRGWELRRTAARTYDVLDADRKKIGTLKSGTGYFPG